MLKRAVGAGRPVMVYLNMFHVHDDFSQISKFWHDVLGKDKATHYMVVKGYDLENVYLNDPTDPTNAAGSLSAKWEDFMQAWGDTTDIPNAPPLGPFWMLYLESSGEIPGPKEMISLNLLRAIEAPAEIRSFAENVSDSEFTLFLLLELGNARKRFGEYLSRNGEAAGGDLYQQAGESIKQAVFSKTIDSGTMKQIADLEEEAIALLRD